MTGPNPCMAGCLGICVQIQFTEEPEKGQSGREEL